MSLTIHILLCFISIIFIPKISTIVALAQHETYIIHMDSSAMPKAFTSQHSWFLNTFASAVVLADELSTYELSSKLKTYPNSRFLYSYTKAIHGFSASLSPSELEAIKNSLGYVYSTRETEVKLDTTHSPQFIGLNPTSGAWPASHYGEDIIVGLIDTGIWPESKSFSDEGFPEIPSRWKGECETGTQFNSSLCNKKLIGARYFNKGLLAMRTNLTIAMNSARDTDGHGTHTSSTAAGSPVPGASYFGYAPGTSTGVASRARVAMYKALWDEGVALSDVIAAIDLAILDGVDVLSLSLGIDGTPLYEDPIAIAAFSAMEQNIFVSASAGNEGPFFATLHNGTPWVLTVAAGTVDREFAGTVTLSNGESVPGLSIYPGNTTEEKTTMVFADKCNDQNELKKVADKIIVCLDKNDTLEEQIYHLGHVNATAVVFITNTTDLEFDLLTKFPAIFLNLHDGEKVLDFIAKSSGSGAVGSIKFRETRLGAKPAPRVTSYSSRGPSRSCPKILKPDIMAPGALILASWPSDSLVTELNSGKLFNDFNIISGTSMSCPHVAGVGALLKAVHPKWSPAAIRSAMMTTADVMDNTMSPIGDIGLGNRAATPLAMGSGHINPSKALDPGLVYDAGAQDYINLLCALNFTSKQIQTIVKTSSYNCSSPSLDLNYPSFIAYFKANTSGSIQFDRTVTNVGAGASEYAAKVSEMDGVKVTVVPDKLVFSSVYEKKSFKVAIEGELEGFLENGSLSWVETGGGKHVVTSPIVVTSLNVQIVSL